jgi:hypothetical protein
MSLNNEPLFISRSALLTYQTCNRKYFYSNEFNSHGISSSYINRDLLIGSAIHRGLQHLFEHCRLNHPFGDFDETCVDEAVKVALELYDKETSNPNCNIGVKRTEDLGYVLIECRYLVEALIRTYSLVRLPLFLEEYEILEVEKEDSLNFGNDIVFLAKADGLLRRKSDNKLVVLSIKTISEFVDEGSSKKVPTIQAVGIDMQGNSEAYVIKNRLNEWYKHFKALGLQLNSSVEGMFAWMQANLGCNKEVFDYFVWVNNNNKEIKVNLIQYEHLIKGEMSEWGQNSGIYRRHTPLLHPYYLDLGFNLRSGVSDKNQFAITFGKGRPPKGWEKVDVWKYLSIKEWIDMLASGEIQPELGDVLSKFIRGSDVIFRDDDEQLEWFISTKTLVKEINNKRFAMNNDPMDYAECLATYYPKDTQQCLKYYGSLCTYYSICHQGVNPDEALNDRLYQIRRPHHDSELKSFEEKGFV